MSKEMVRGLKEYAGYAREAISDATRKRPQRENWSDMMARIEREGYPAQAEGFTEVSGNRARVEEYGTKSEKSPGGYPKSRVGKTILWVGGSFGLAKEIAGYVADGIRILDRRPPRENWSDMMARHLEENGDIFSTKAERDSLERSETQVASVPEQIFSKRGRGKGNKGGE